MTSNYPELLTFLWLTLWAFIASRSLLKGQSHSVNFAILVHFVLCGVPALLNVIVSKPMYLSFPNFNIQDSNVDILYGIYVSICPVIWWYFGKCKKLHDYSCKRKHWYKQEITSHQGFRFALYVFAVSPILFLLFAPSPSFYCSYAAIINAPTTDEILAYHNWIIVSTLLSVLAIAGIWSLSRKILATILLWMPMLLITFWLSGKRFVVLLAVALLVVILWERRVLIGWKLGAFAVFSIFGIALFSYSYQTGIRSTNLLDAVEKYENFRIDYGRDHGIKYAIYCELHPEQSAILEYRGESILFDLTMFVPRAIWPDKPWPYAIYSTAAGQGIPPQDLGWTITASCLEQAVAEFGFLAFLIAPALLALVCRMGDSCQSVFIRFLTIILTCLMLSMTGAFSMIKITWFFSILIFHLKRNLFFKALHDNLQANSSVNHQADQTSDFSIDLA